MPEPTEKMWIRKRIKESRKQRKLKKGEWIGTGRNPGGMGRRN